MALLRPTFEGLGSASGVAWPIFGMVSSALSLGIGGAATFLLGGVCGTIFLLASLPIMYLSYKKSKQEQEQFNKKQDHYEALLLNNLSALFAKTKQYKGLDSAADFYDFLNKKIKELNDENTKDKKLIANLLNYLKLQSIYDFYKHSDSETFDAVLKARINQFLLNQLNEQSHLVNNSDKGQAAFLGFVGAFGTIAGGSAGFTGLLIGLGLMASFSVIPWAAFAIIITAAIIGTYVALDAVELTEFNAAKMYWYKSTKTLGNFLQKLNAEIEAKPILEELPAPVNSMNTVTNAKSHPHKDPNLYSNSWTSQKPNEAIITKAYPKRFFKEQDNFTQDEASNLPTAVFTYS
ncbi:Uncharacterised protein [Legionella beliardensis]|uniref:Uncharacterized protein n=1 Tax=Legionella beliardensis TaxID=91822 RepID=A0A378I4E4_9GAMM|nr:hypothetical protein [Legionella beliardensis]STX30058.1 Uncharacterised protein [Legionella beliardensis]